MYRFVPFDTPRRAMVIKPEPKQVLFPPIAPKSKKKLYVNGRLRLPCIKNTRICEESVFKEKFVLPQISH